ncbi:vacuolar segregation protein [Grosmannia clavigera kw1407]|uniref:Vacuolar segregation protein n=1 Tax=Grosmannia clavigera (strain kw1407 / UAMH 11150) TaxID=655863 RepID=F0XIU9_GROCL|nr:vacuolar segregation protein [Grosmannia clavigera kw1407]EFX02435.1 vacuolar segregation protein [Grosmannia clavigera kw1407]
MYQTKLSRAAKYDPIRGYWVRVCETCYKSRPGYNEHRGAEIDLTRKFMATRQQRIERQNLEIGRLEKRLTKLTQLIADAAPDLAITAGGTLAGHNKARKAIEQSVVTWEDDAAVVRCPFCQQEFGTWTFRRHHCRICGRVVCADPQTECSTEVGLSVAAHRDIAADRMISPAASEKTHAHTAESGSTRTASTAAGQVSVDIRMCRDCKATIFSKRDFEEEMSRKPPDQRAYETLRQFEWGIRQMMPLFQRALQSLQADGPGKPPPTHGQIQEAAKIRKRLMDSFAKYNLAAVRLRDLSTQNPSQKRLQRAVYTAASTFLHANMVPLKHLPKMLRAKQPGAANALSPHRKALSPLNGSGLHLSPLRNGELLGDGDTASLAGSEVSTAVSALETEEKELREKLVVLEEQRFLVQQMVDNARGSRRFEEVGALSRNVEELDREIARLKHQVGGVEERWEGLYAIGAP